MNLVVLNIGRSNICFSRTSAGSEEFRKSLKGHGHSALQAMFKDPKLSPDNRTGVLNELVARAWANLSKDGKKQLTDLLGQFKNGALRPDGLRKMAGLLDIDADEFRVASSAPPPAAGAGGAPEKPTASMTYDAIYTELKAANTTPERRKNLVDELGIRQCDEMPEGENRNKLVVLLIRHREGTLSQRDSKNLAWYLGIPADQLAPPAPARRHG